MKKLLALALASGALVAANVATAASFTDSDSFTDLTPEFLDANGFTFELDKWDVNALPAPDPGFSWQLDNVLVTLTFFLDTAGTVTNTSGVDVGIDIDSATISLGAQVFDDGNSLGVTFDWSDLLPPADGLLLTHSETYNSWLDGQTLPFGPGSDDYNENTVFGGFGNDPVNPFIGAGTWTNRVTGQGATLSVGITNFSQSISTFVDGTMTVQYIYSQVPEEVPLPATALLMGVGLIGLGASYRRKAA